MTSEEAKEKAKNIVIQHLPEQKGSPDFGELVDHIAVTILQAEDKMVNRCAEVARKFERAEQDPRYKIIAHLIAQAIEALKRKVSTIDTK